MTLPKLYYFVSVTSIIFFVVVSIIFCDAAMRLGVVEEQTEFERWIEGLEHHFGNKTLVAKAAGLTVSVYLRAVETGTLGIAPLLRLAAATGEDASAVLRRAGKRQLADLIELNYGVSKPTPPHLREAVALLEQLPEWAVKAQIPGLRAIAQALSQGQSVAGTPLLEGGPEVTGEPSTREPGDQ